MTNREFLHTVVESMTDQEVVGLFMSGCMQDWFTRQVCETCSGIHGGRCPDKEDGTCRGGIGDLEWLRMEHAE